MTYVLNLSHIAWKWKLSKKEALYKKSSHPIPRVSWSLNIIKYSIDVIKHWLCISNKFFWAYVIERPWVWAYKLETWAREVKKN